MGITPLEKDIDGGEGQECGELHSKNRRMEEKDSIAKKKNMRQD